MIRSGVNRARFARVCRVLSGLGFTVLAAGLMLHGCTIGKPQVPTTDWTLRVPLADDRTTILEVVEGRGEYLAIDPDDNSMQFEYTHEMGLDKQELGERLQLPGLSPDPFETGVGEIRIPAQTLPDFTFKMSQMVGQDAFDQLSVLESVPLVPASEINQVSDLKLQDTEKLIVREGGINVTLENGLPLPLDLDLELLDREQGDKVVSTMTGLPDQIAPNSQETGVFDLSGVEISGNLAIRVVGGSLEAKDVEIVGDPELVIKSAIQTLIVDEATAKVDPLTLADDQTIPFPTQKVIVKSAAIKEGSITLTVTNNIPVGVTVILELNDLEKDGNTLKIPLDTMSPNAITTNVVTLDGYEFIPDPANPDNEERTHLSLSYSANTLASEGVVEISSEGASISVEAQTSDLVFEEIEGTLNNLSMDDLGSIEREIPNVPDGLENIKFESTSLVAWLTSKVGFQSQIKLQVEGSNAVGETGDFTVEEIFERYDSGVDPESGKVIQIELDPEDLTDFLNLLPNSIAVTPSIKVGDGLGQERVSSTDWVRVDSVIFGSMPRFQITQNDFIELPATERNIEDDEARRRIQDNLIGASVRTVIENHIPLAVRVRVFVGATEESVYTDPLFTIETEDGTPFGVEAAPVDGQGRTTNSRLGEPQTIELSKEDALELMREGGFWTGIRVEFDETDGNVEVLGSDWISIKAATEVILELNKSLLE